MNKKDLSESDIKAKFITPAIICVGWDEQTQLGREIFFTDGRIYVKGRMTQEAKESSRIIYFSISRMCLLLLLKLMTTIIKLEVEFNRI